MKRLDGCAPHLPASVALERRGTGWRARAGAWAFLVLPRHPKAPRRVLWAPWAAFLDNERLTPWLNTPKLAARYGAAVLHLRASRPASLRSGATSTSPRMKTRS